MAVGAYAAYNLALRLPQTNIILVFLFAGVMAMLVGLLFGFPRCASKAFTSRSRRSRPSSSSNGPSRASNGSPTTRPPARSRSVGSSCSDFRSTRRPRPTSSCSRLCRAHPRREESGARRIGRMWMAIRDMDIAAEIIGIRPLHAKLSAFAVSSFYIGGRRRAVGLSATRLVGAVGVRCQSLIPGAVHDHHRRTRHPLGVVSRRRFHRSGTDRSQQLHPGSGLACRPTRSRTSSSCCSGAIIVFFLIAERTAWRGFGRSQRRSFGCGPSRIEAATIRRHTRAQAG